MNILHFCINIVLVGFQQTDPKDEAFYYQINSFKNGKISSEGWIQNGQKTKYWKFYNPYGVVKAKGHFKNDIKEKYWYTYHANGKLKSEGHYSVGQKTSWWNFYNTEEQLTEKCQYKDNQWHGYRVLLTNERPYKVERYQEGKKTDEWNSYTSFILDHPELLGT